MYFNFVLVMWFFYHMLCLSFYMVSCLEDDLGEVVFVNFLFRHGDRTPIEPYPNDPYKDERLWPVGWGQLTDAGKRGHYELGKWFRMRYGQLLPKEYKPEDIYIRSTDVDRTLMSSYSNLAGLYEPDLKYNWNSEIKWTPIPVHTIPRHSDVVLAAEAPCLRYDSEMKQLKNSPEFLKMNKENKPLYDFLTKHTGMNVTCVDDVQKIYDTLFIEDLHKLQLPNWTKDVYPQHLRRIAEFSFAIPCYTQSLARLKVGPLLSEIVHNMQEKISMKMNRKAWMYSAHDTTVANCLQSLGIFDIHSPPYYSTILIELREKNKDYYVAIHYRNSSQVPPYFMKLKDCDKLCPFEKFKSIVSPLIPQNRDEECRSVDLENFYNTAASVGFITIVCLALIFLLSLGVVVKFYKNQRCSQPEFEYKNLNLAS